MCGLGAEFPSPVSAATEDARSLRDAARHALKMLTATHPDLSPPTDAELWIERALPVLARNIASGRFARASRYAQDTVPSLSGYAQRVLRQLMTEWDRVEAFCAGDNKGWSLALKHLERLAYFWLNPVGREAWAKWEAREAAALTCEDLWHWLQHHPFAFDVPFDRWTERALRNRLKDSARLRCRHARHVVDSLDRPCFEDDLTFGELLPGDDMADWLERESSRETLRQGYARLDEREARIVHMWYEEGRSAEEIAAETGLQIGHIYVLRHRAVTRLRAYCADD